MFTLYVGSKIMKFLTQFIILLFLQEFRPEGRGPKRHSSNLRVGNILICLNRGPKDRWVMMTFFVCARKYRVATHQKVKNSLTFHWPFINEKQSMFTFTLAFFTGYQYFCLHFRPLSAFCGKRKKEFGRKHSQWKPLTTTTTCIGLRVLNWLLCLLCSILFLFSKRKCILKSGRQLMNDKPENRIP